MRILVLLGFCSSLLAQKAPQAPSQEFPDLGLTLRLPKAVTELQASEQTSEQLRKHWTAKLGSVELEISFFVMPIQEFGFQEPEDVIELLLENVRAPGGLDPSFAFTQQRLVPGEFGVCSYASLAYGPWHADGATQETGLFCSLGGILEKHGYSLEVHATPVPGPEGVRALEEWLKSSVRFQGKARDPKWTEEEARERWTRSVPEKLAKKLEKIIRTQHYLVLTNSSGGKNFAEQMEKNYQAIQKVFPFEEVAGRKLMPVFLFQTPEEYYEFYAKLFQSTVAEAERSKGVAYQDWYATWYEAPNDPVHIHEGTHQIFENRLRLPGGGSWFQEGVAEYMTVAKNELNVAARVVKSGKQRPMREFMTIESLLLSDSEEDQAADSYAMAALVIEFARTKPKFQNFIHSVGKTPAGSLPAIERALRSSLGLDLAGLEAEFVQYCKKR